MVTTKHEQLEQQQLVVEEGSGRAEGGLEGQQQLQI
jgi:hypothetical protein